MTKNTTLENPGVVLAVPRSRGLLSGVLLILLGAWGALLPLAGPYFNFGYGADTTWHLTAARFWLQVLPGGVTFLAGLFIAAGGNRVTGTFAAFLAVVSGAWFVVGPTLADLHQKGYVGAAMGSSDRQHVEMLAAFTGLGVVIAFVAALAAGRLTVVGVRDVETKVARHTDNTPATAAPTTLEVDTVNIDAKSVDLTDSGAAAQK